VNEITQFKRKCQCI